MIMKHLKLLLSLTLMLLVTGLSGLSQSDTIDVAPASIDLSGDVEGLRYDPDERFAFSVIFEHLNNQDEAAIIALLRDDPSPYEATRSTLFGVLNGFESLSVTASDFLHDYAFENGLPDEDLSATEFTALLNAALSVSDLIQLISWHQLLQSPDLIGGGTGIEQRQFDFFTLKTELQNHSNLRFREQLKFFTALEQSLFVTSARKETFWSTWLNLNRNLTGTLKDGASQLLTLVALDEGVEGSIKRDLILSELGVSVGDGFKAAQYGPIYVVLKGTPLTLRNNLRQLVTLDIFNPSAANNPDSNIAGQYSNRRIGLRTTLNERVTAEVLAHEIGHLAFATILTSAQRSEYSRLHNQSSGGDFVTDYAQTNQNEDFADTFEEYMVDTVGWLGRDLTSDILRQKFAIVATVLGPYIYKTTSGLGGVQIQRAMVPCVNGLPNISGTINWEVL
jgi:hypothetical protein